MNQLLTTETLRPGLVVGTRRANTLGGSVEFAGQGLHTGEEVVIRLLSASEGTGIRFVRTDLPGRPEVFAHIQNVEKSQRNTTIREGDAEIHTVEHVLAALKAYQIDNAVIELSGSEPPAAGGCSRDYVEMIEKVGVEVQEGDVPIVALDRPVFFSQGNVHAVAVPSEEFRVSYTLHYPEVAAIRSQYLSLAINPTTFRDELSSCRTFVLYEEVKPLLDAGLIKGGSLESAVVVKGDTILNQEGLRFPDELVRHKILDVVGDLSLVGVDLRMHVLAVCCGHAANAELAKELFKYIRRCHGDR